jgi:NADH dehydrogenase FAD-containing subunit
VSVRHRVVVVGAGFGGSPAVRRLGRVPVEVTLVDRRNHHVSQPLLYQVATAMLSPGQIAPPIRHVVRKYQRVRVELAEVTGFDVDRRVVRAITLADLRTMEIRRRPQPAQVGPGDHPTAPVPQRRNQSLIVGRGPLPIARME